MKFHQELIYNFHQILQMILLHMMIILLKQLEKKIYSFLQFIEMKLIKKKKKKRKQQQQLVPHQLQQEGLLHLVEKHWPLHLILHVLPFLNHLYNFHLQLKHLFQDLHLLHKLNQDSLNLLLQQDHRQQDHRLHH
jgi:hypothetical protein